MIEVKIEVTGRRGRRHKQLWDDLTEKGLDGEKDLEGTIFHNAYTQKGQSQYQKLSLHDTSASDS
jgi:hypothetical protein